MAKTVKKKVAYGRESPMIDIKDKDECYQQYLAHLEVKNMSERIEESKRKKFHSVKRRNMNKTSDPHASILKSVHSSQSSCDSTLILKKDSTLRLGLPQDQSRTVFMNLGGK
jgi:hypothetical protein